MSFLSQLRSYNRHTLVADPYEDGLGDLLIKKQKMIELEKKVWFSVSARAAPLQWGISPSQLSALSDVIDTIEQNTFCWLVSAE